MKLAHRVAAITLIAANVIFGLSLFEAQAQQTIRQSGPWASNRAPMYSGNGTSTPTLQDSGPAAGGAPGVGLNEQLLTIQGFSTTGPNANAGTGPYGTNWCDYDAPITSSGGYHYLCLSPNAQGGGLIAYGAGGGAPNLPLQMNVNGVTYSFPFSTTGIVGPATTTVGYIPLWNNTTGTLLSSGVPVPAGGFGTMKGPVSTTLNNIVTWNSTDGTLTGNGPAIPFGGFGTVKGPPSTTATNIVTWNSSDGTLVGTGLAVPSGGLGNVTGTSPSIIGSVPVWTNATGTALNSGPASLLAGSATFSLTIGGVPAMSFPATFYTGVSTYGPNTIVGYRAGVGMNIGAIETTSIGQAAGGGNGWALLVPGVGIGGGTGLTGVENTFTGFFAGTQMTTGQANAAFGNGALGLEITGSFNTAIGHDTMRNSIGATSSTSIGSNAGRNDSGQYNTFVGDSSGFGTDPALGQPTTTTGTSNVGVGASTLFKITTGSQNTAVGKGALANLTTGANNTVIGGGAAANGAAGSYNTLVGQNAATSASFNGQFNVGVGVGSLANSTTGNASVALGTNALAAQTTGSNNVAIGTSVGQTTLTTGSGNIYLGTNSLCDAASAGESNTFRLCNATGYPNLLSGDLTAATPSLSINGNIISTGTAPVFSGACPIVNQGMGSNGGIFTLNGNCTAGTVIFTFLKAAPHGWACATQNIQSASDVIRQSTFSTTTATFTITGTSGDYFSAICTGV